MNFTKLIIFSFLIISSYTQADSFGSKAAKASMRAMGVKYYYSYVSTLIHNRDAFNFTLNAQLRLLDVHYPSSKFSRNHKVKQVLIQGFKVYLISNKHSYSPKKVVMYLHGGAFIIGPTKQHWELASYLVENDKDLTVALVDYPKGPEYNYIKTYDVLLETYKKLNKQYKNVSLLGDSAGATLSIGLTQMLADKKLPLPLKVIAASPMLDAQLKNPAISSYEWKDPFLGRDWARDIVTVWNNRAYNNKYVSPMIAKMTHNVPIHLFCGTSEIFYPDCMKFTRQSTNVILRTGDNLMHDWIIANYKEAKQSKKEISRLLR